MIALVDTKFQPIKIIFECCRFELIKLLQRNQYFEHHFLDGMNLSIYVLLNTKMCLRK